jgi:ribosomal protein S16
VGTGWRCEPRPPALRISGRSLIPARRNGSGQRLLLPIETPELYWLDCKRRRDSTPAVELGFELAQETDVAVRLRLKRFGRRHRPSYRVAAMDNRSPRDGRVIEELGLYDPMAKDSAQQVSLKRERIQYWLSVGAQPSDTVRDLLKREGIVGR